MMRALHIAWKDIRVWTRDVSAMGILLGMPVVLILILGSALGGAASGGDAAIPVAVVNLDDGQAAVVQGSPSIVAPPTSDHLGDELVSAIRGSKRIDRIADVTVSRTLGPVQAKVADGEIAAALVIPVDFTRRVTDGKPVELKVLGDPGSELSAGIWESIVRSLAGQYSAASISVQTATKAVAEQRASEPQSGWLMSAVNQNAIVAATKPGALETVQVDDEQIVQGVKLTAIDFYGLSMTSMFLMFGAMFGAFSTIKERREQTLSRLLTTPTGAAAVTGGKMLGIFALGMAQFSVLYLFTRFAFGVNWGDDVLAVFVVAAAEVLAVTGLAVVIASLARTERGAGGLGPLVIQIQALIGGAFFTITVLPEWIQPIRYFSVIGWTMEGWSTVQLRGGHVSDVLAPVGALMGFAVLFFLFGAWRTAARR